MASMLTCVAHNSVTGLDYFGARYYSGAQGRFTSPDQPFLDWDLADPRSWNLYGYVRNNPLLYTDSTGQACVVDKNGKESDDKSGGQSCADAHKASENDKPSVTVTAQKGSLFALLTAPTIPRYVEKDKPLPENSQKVLADVGKTTASVAILGDCAAASFVPFLTGAGGESVYQLGQPTVLKPFAPPGANPYTSVLSEGARGLFGNARIPSIPTVIRGANGALKISRTGSAAGALGRALPVLGRAAGVAGLAVGLYQTGACVSRN